MKIKKIFFISSIVISSLIFTNSLILGADSSDDGNSEVGILYIDNDTWICKYSEDLDEDEEEVSHG